MMAGIRHPKEIRSKVLKMGLSGKTYAQIRAVFPIPKSTLSFWFKRAHAPRTFDRSRMLKHLAKVRELGLQTIMNRRQAWIKEARELGIREASQLNVADPVICKVMLAMLYWAEGAKHAKAHGLVFVNTDPTLMRLYVSLLRKSYPVDETRFKARLHLHHYHSHRAALKFWSELLEIPTSQFGKIYVKKRSKRKRFRKNFQGICFVKYPLNPAREELLALGKAIAERVR